MKIGIASAISVSSLQEFLDGVEEQHLVLGRGAPAVDNLIRGLIYNGHQVSVYTLDSKPIKPLILRGKNLTIYIGKYRLRARHRMLDLFKYESDQIEQFIRDDKPEFVNAHWTYEYALAAINARVPHLLTFRDDAWEILKLQKDMYRIVRFLLDQRVRRAGQYFSVNSEYLQKQLAGFRPYLPVISNPVNDHFLAEVGKPHPKNLVRIISIANGWGRRKNVHVAISAFKLLRQKYGDRVEFHLAGKEYGPGQEAEKWAQANDCMDGLHFQGRISHHTLMSGLRAYDILLHPALEESFGNTLIEGMGCGLPVIGGKDAGAVPWVLGYGQKGLLVDVTSAEEIAQALETLVEDGALYEKLSNNGIGYVRDSFSCVQIARKYENLYREILAGKPQEALLQEALAK